MEYQVHATVFVSGAMPIAYLVVQPTVMGGCMTQPMDIHREACMADSPYTTDVYTVSPCRPAASGLGQSQAVPRAVSTKVHGWEMDMNKVLLARLRRCRRHPCNVNLRRVSRCCS